MQRAGYALSQCIWMARAAWLATGLWFAIILFASFGWVGFGPAFLYWTAPAAVLSGMTLVWWLRVPVRIGSWYLAGVGLLWLGLAVAAWDGGDRLVPAALWTTLSVLFVAFPVLLTTAVIWRIGRIDPRNAAV